MKAIVPFKIVNAKSRLSMLLTPEERKELALLMLRDITSTLTAAGVEVELLTTRPFVWDGARAVVSEKELNPALNDYIAAQDGPIMIVMADVPLITEKNIRDIIGSRADLVICPGRGGGTNLQFIRRPDRYHVDYYGASFLDHIRIAEENGLSSEVYDSFNISSDIDEAGDLVELYIHGRGEAAKYLRSLVVLDASKGRVQVVREETNIHAVRIPGKMTG